MARPVRQAGLSLVEMMVSLALGLFVTTIGLAGLAGHLRESRSLGLDARVSQDLRAAADLMVRNLRRAGHWREAGSAVRSGAANPHGACHVAPALAFAYQRDDDAASSHFAYRLREGVIEVQMGQGHWQALTDAGSVTVTALRLTPETVEHRLDGFCTKPCGDDAGATGPPRQQQRRLQLRIEAHAAHDTGLRRQIDATVHAHNDVTVGSCPA
jgi:prepilin peptidase dependent protein B